MADKSTAPSAELPPLPEPHKMFTERCGLRVYLSDQMHSYAASAVAAALQTQHYVNAGYLNGFNYSATKTNALSVPVYIRVAATPTAPAASPVPPASDARDEPICDGCGKTISEHDRLLRCHGVAPAPVLPAGDALTEDQIKQMADRLMVWKLPDNFRPVGGISFKKCQPGVWPVGTNLLSYEQACDMLRFISQAGQADSEQPLGANSTGGANG
jgi:hypothetical protein